LDHLTELELRAYCGRTLAADDLLRVSGHIAECGNCRGKLRQLTSPSAAIQILRTHTEEHFSAEQLQQFIDGGLQQAQRRRIDEHLSWCAECRGDVESLRESARAWKKPAAAPRRAVGWWLAAAAALLVAMGLSLWFQRPRVVVALSDGSGRVTLDSRGGLHGVAGLTTAQADSIRRVLTGGALRVPRILAELQPQPGALMGSANPPPFHLRSPVGTVVDSPVPTLRWTAWTPAATYIVTLKNLQSGQVVSSPVLNVPEWKPSQALRPGAIYEWQVAATWNGSEELAPTPPAPPARFQILASAQAQQLERLPESHLTRAIVFAEAGLMDRAKQEAEALAESNPGAPVAAALAREIEELHPVRH